MPLLAGDIRFARSANMADVPEGGGPPSAQLLTSGRSNEVFPDISEETRTVGRVEIYQIFSVLRNSDRTPLLGGNVILAEPPADPNISITTLSLRNPFATRADIAKRIESGMSAGPEWNGYLLENHYTTMRSVTVLQRPGVPPPTIGRTYLLVHNEGLAGEYRQRVRIKATTTETRLFTEIGANGEPVDFLAQSTACELFDGLLYDFPGSPPSRTFARNSTKTKIRETVYSDSGMFYGASPLVQPTAINDVWLKVASIYTQIVPNSRTEVASVDQYPSARHTITLAETPRKIEVGVTPHTQRIRIAEENAGMVYVALLKPAPAAGTVFIDFWSLGQRYTLTDDGTGKLVGQGSGSVDYLTGALQLTLKSIPDIGSFIAISHGEKSAYTNRSGQAGFRAPEFAWTMPHAGIKPGSVVVTWMSGGVLKTATDNNSGGFTGHANGEIDYATGKIYLRPTAMIDAGGEFQTAYEYASVRTENFNAPAIDAGGFGSLTLAEAPAPKSITVRWITVRNVSASSGTSEIVSSSGTETVIPQVAVSGGTASGNHIVANTNYAPPSSTVQFRAGSNAPLTHGIYTWEASSHSVPDASVVFGVASGTVELIAPGVYSTNEATFSLTVDSSCPDLYFTLKLKSPSGDVIAESQSVKVGPAIAVVEPPWVDPPDVPVVTREPVGTSDAVTGSSKLLPQMFPAGDRFTKVGEPQYPHPVRMYVRVDPEVMPSGFLAGIGAYDAPDLNRPLPIVWTDAEFEAKQKQMASKTGVLKTYKIWGESYV